MESKNQTAIEWLVDEFKDVILKEYAEGRFNELINQAKEMEEEQMKEVAWHFKEVDMEKSNKGNIIDLEFNQYYNETYGKQ